MSRDSLGATRIKKCIDEGDWYNRHHKKYQIEGTNENKINEKSELYDFESTLDVQLLFFFGCAFFQIPLHNFFVKCFGQFFSWLLQDPCSEKFN